MIEDFSIQFSAFYLLTRSDSVGRDIMYTCIHYVYIHIYYIYIYTECPEFNSQTSEACRELSYMNYKCGPKVKSTFEKNMCAIHLQEIASCFSNRYIYASKNKLARRDQ